MEQEPKPESKSSRRRNDYKPSMSDKKLQKMTRAEITRNIDVDKDSLRKIREHSDDYPINVAPKRQLYPNQ